LKCDGTLTETRYRLSAKRTNPFKSAGASVQSTTGSRGVRISGSNAGYTMLRGSVKCTGYPLHSPVSPSLPIPCVTTCAITFQLDSKAFTTRYHCQRTSGNLTELQGESVSIKSPFYNISIYRYRRYIAINCGQQTVAQYRGLSAVYWESSVK